MSLWGGKKCFSSGTGSSDTEELQTRMGGRGIFAQRSWLAQMSMPWANLPLTPVVFLVYSVEPTLQSEPKSDHFCG